MIGKAAIVATICLVVQLYFSTRLVKDDTNEAGNDVSDDNQKITDTDTHGLKGKAKTEYVDVHVQAEGLEEGFRYVNSHLKDAVAAMAQAAKISAKAKTNLDKEATSKAAVDVVETAKVEEEAAAKVKDKQGVTAKATLRKKRKKRRRSRKVKKSRRQSKSPEDEDEDEDPIMQFESNLTTLQRGKKTITFNSFSDSKCNDPKIIGANGGNATEGLGDAWAALVNALGGHASWEIRSTDSPFCWKVLSAGKHRANVGLGVYWDSSAGKHLPDWDSINNQAEEEEERMAGDEANEQAEAERLAVEAAEAEANELAEAEAAGDDGGDDDFDDDLDDDDEDEGSEEGDEEEGPEVITPLLYPILDEDDETCAPGNGRFMNEEGWTVSEFGRFLNHECVERPPGTGEYGMLKIA